VREATSVEKAATDAGLLLQSLPERLRVSDPRAVSTAFWAADLCLAHRVYLEAIRTYLEAGGRSRGSALVLDPEGKRPCPGLEEEWRFRCNDEGASVDGEILEVWMETHDRVETRWVPVRPIPQDQGWFEEVWKAFREDRIIR
jgi:hypothetical protein